MQRPHFELVKQMLLGLHNDLLGPSYKTEIGFNLKPHLFSQFVVHFYAPLDLFLDLATDFQGLIVCARHLGYSSEVVDNELFALLKS